MGQMRGCPQGFTLGGSQDLIFQRLEVVGRGGPRDVGRRRSLVLHEEPHGDVHTSWMILN